MEAFLSLSNAQPRAATETALSAFAIQFSGTQSIASETTLGTPQKQPSAVTLLNVSVKLGCKSRSIPYRKRRKSSWLSHGTSTSRTAGFIASSEERFLRVAAAPSSRPLETCRQTEAPSLRAIIMAAAPAVSQFLSARDAPNRPTFKTCPARHGARVRRLWLGKW